jgi:hypothetical protein
VRRDSDDGEGRRSRLGFFSTTRLSRMLSQNTLESTCSRPTFERGDASSAEVQHLPVLTRFCPGRSGAVPSHTTRARDTVRARVLLVEPNMSLFSTCEPSTGPGGLCGPRCARPPRIQPPGLFFSAPPYRRSLGLRSPLLELPTLSDASRPPRARAKSQEGCQARGSALGGRLR